MSILGVAEGWDNDLVAENKPTIGKPLRTLTIALWAVGLIFVGVVAVCLLLFFYGQASEADKQRLDIIRTAGTIVVGTGGVAALYLAARRQQSAELTLQHQRDVAASTERDATERRVSEQYTKAAEQLGSDKAPVRLAGLYALERLGNADGRQRQSIVSILSAYLRMPFTPPASAVGRAARSEGDRERQRREELEVQKAAQQILQRVSAPYPSDPTAWDIGRVNLNGAYLHKFSLGKSACSFSFMGSIFEDVNFAYSHFGHFVHLVGAEFRGRSLFEATEFDDACDFAKARVLGEVSFRRTRFCFNPGLDTAAFSRPPDLSGAIVAAAEGDAVRLRELGTLVGDEDRQIGLPEGWTAVPTGDQGVLEIVSRRHRRRQTTSAEQRPESRVRLL